MKESLDHFFRKEYSKLVSLHTSKFGVGHLELIEDSVQDALVDATERWRFSGIPENPAGWLYQVSKNKCLDKFKYLKVRQVNETTLIDWYETKDESYADHYFDDEQLIMMFTCAHPLLKQEDQIALTLKILCGFSSGEIAKALISNSKTIEQRIVRAKRKLRDENVLFEKPSETEIEVRLNLVLKTIYLLFNEGYHSNSGAKQIRRDLCSEAIRLIKLLTNSKLTVNPESFALLALMLFQMSRFDAREDENGDILLLHEQNRSKWNQAFISEGVEALTKSSVGKVISEYHLQAGIAACHALSQSDELTDWKRIVFQYSMLIDLNPNPIYKLNSAVAKYMNREKISALNELKSLEFELKDYYLYSAVMGEIYLRENQKKNALKYFEDALILVENESFRRFIEKKKLRCIQ